MTSQIINSDCYPVTPLTRVRRLANLASYDTNTVYSVLDAAYVCHVAFTVEGQPHCIPTAHWRHGNTLYIHGSFGSRLLQALINGASAVVTVTLLDGLVFARSAFNHSMNYRSVVIYGQFSSIEVPAQKIELLRAFMERLAPGRWDEIRQPTENELNATTLLAMPIEEAVAKISSGPPKDDLADCAWPVWAGVLPIKQDFAAPQGCSDLPAGIALPNYFPRGAITGGNES
ncbi:MAG: pyridoxamine 5'-phosphate oxidase family protein [Pseudomonadota bacterium]